MKRINKNNIGHLFNRLLKSVWLFPVILIVILMSLTALRISGSSVGIYHPIIYGDTKDPNLLYGHPESIRSDEWLATTQMSLAQKAAGYPHINKNLGTGRDMSLTSDAPYKDWSTIFKPQNLSFLVMPFENAFAFKWWFLLFMLIISCYFFSLRIFPGKRLFAALFATAIGFSPFVFWWYITSAFAPLFYGFFIMILGMRVLNKEPVVFLKSKPAYYSNIVYSLGLAYLIAGMALTIYPPFIIPVAIVSIFFLAGYLAEQEIINFSGWQKLIKKVSVLVAGLAIGIALIGSYAYTRQDAIKALMNTVYPGARVVNSGHLSYFNVLDGFVQPQLQLQNQGTHFFNNQSEASNFILLSPFLILPALFLTGYEYLKSKKIDWLLISIEACVLLFFARVFIPFGDSLYKLLLLDKVPNERLLIGMGIASVVLTLLVMRKVIDLKIKPRNVLIASSVYSLFCFAALVRIGYWMSSVYPLFIANHVKIWIYAAVFSMIVFLSISRRIILVASLLLIFSFGSVYQIHPLYRGMGWIGGNDLYSHIQKDSAPGSTWVSADTLVFENFGLLANRNSVSGVQPYPDIKFWSDAAGKQYDYIYNRYAHVLFMSNPVFKDPVKLVQTDFFEAGITCGPLITKHVNYVLDTAVLTDTCLELTDTVTYPAATFYIYTVNPVIN